MQLQGCMLSYKCAEQSHNWETETMDHSIA